MSTLKRSFVMPGLLGLLVATTVVATGQSAIAQTTQEMIATAEKACLDAAVEKGYDAQLSQVVSSESIDNDTVEVVLNLTKDGTGFDRLTCPYSVSQGLAVFDDAAAAVTAAADTIAAPRFPWWWLLLPLIALPLLLWWTRGREGTVVAADDIVRDYANGYVNTYGNILNVHERPDGLSHILRTLSDGTYVELTGRRDDFWVELRDGGWVDSRSLRFSEGTTPRYA